jgi:hypothetical protein
VVPLSVDIIPTSPWERQFPHLAGYNPFADVPEPDPNFSGLHQRAVRPISPAAWQAEREAGRTARRSLATAHIGRKPDSMTYAKGGNLIRLVGHYPTTAVRRLRQSDTPTEADYRAILHTMRSEAPMDDCEAGARAAARVPGQCGMRGEVHGFSVQSRGRLMRHMLSLPRARLCMPWFITLTYPASWPAEAGKWIAHRRAFLKRLYAEFGATAVIWRLEPQQRGAPHFHLMVFAKACLAPTVADTGKRDWSQLSRWWYDIVASNDPWHFVHGVRDVQRVRSWNGVMSYASKYLCKDSPISLPGRQWGIEHKDLLLIQLVHIALASPAWYAVRRALFALERAHSGTRLRPFGHHAGLWRMQPEALAIRLATWAVPLTYPPRRLYDAPVGAKHVPR